MIVTVRHRVSTFVLSPMTLTRLLAVEDSFLQPVSVTFVLSSYRKMEDPFIPIWKEIKGYLVLMYQ